MTLTASFQGTRLTSSERARIALQQQVRRSFLSDHLSAQVEQALSNVQRLKEQGGQLENPNKYHLEYTAKGTPFLGDVFGF